MNRARVLTELPADMQTWMIAHGTPAQFAETGRAVAISVGHTLLSRDGEGGNVPELHAYLSTESDSPAVRHIAAALGCGERRWSVHQVTKALQAYFALFTAYKAVSRSIRSASVGEVPTDAAA